MNGSFSDFRRTTAWLWLQVALWCALIFYLSSRSSLAGHLDWSTLYGILTFVCRKCAHLTEYAVLLVLFLRASERTWPNRRWLLLISFLFVVAYACTDEYHQTFVPGRSGTVSDVFIDSVGGFAGFWIRHLLLG